MRSVGQAVLWGVPSLLAGAFPSPLWGGVRGGGNPDVGCSAIPPSLSLPHTGGRGRQTGRPRFTCDQRLVGGKVDAPYIARFAERSGKLGRGGIVQEEPRAAVGEDGRELRGGLAPVERHQDRGRLAAGEQHLEKGRRVVAEDRDPLAGGDAEPLECRRTTLGAIVEGGEGEAPAAVRLLEGDRLGRQLGTLGGEIENGVHGARAIPDLCRNILTSLPQSAHAARNPIS